MTWLWIFLALMLVAALVFILYPLLRTHKKGLTAVSFIFSGILLIGSAWLYYYLGGSTLLAEYQEKQREEALTSKYANLLKNPAQLIEMMKAKLAENPHSAKGWYLLGKLYLSLQQYPKAHQAFLESLSINPNNVEAVLANAEAELFLQKGILSDDTRKALQLIVEKDNENISAMQILAMDAYDRKAYSEAIAWWKKMLPFATDESTQKTLLEAIANAEKQQ